MKKATLCRVHTGVLAGLAGVSLAVLSVGCASQSKPVTGATVPADGPKPSVNALSSANAEERVQPSTGFDQPTQPDPAFVQRLVDQFDAVQNASVRELAQRKVVDQRFIDDQRAIYAPEWLQRSLEGWRIEKDALKPKPGAARTTVGEVVRWKQGCIVAAVSTDYSSWFAIQQSPLPKRYVAVVPRPARTVSAQTTTDANPTGWWMTYDGWQDNGLPPDGLCA
jgi:hypothetical protein